MRRSSELPFISVFVFGAYLISWSIWIFGRHFHSSLHAEIAGLTIDTPTETVTLLLGNIGPGLSATLVVVFTQGWEGVRRLWGRLTIWRSNWPLLAFACLIMPCLCSIALLVYWSLGGRIAATGNPARWMLLIVANLPFAPLWEELGWRGFLLPRLQNKHSGLIASLLLAGVWAPWHLPLYWNFSVGYIFWFLIMVLALAIVFTWVYNRSGGSLIPVVLLHTMVNTTNLYLLKPTLTLVGTVPYLLFVGSTSLAALTIVLTAGSSLGKGQVAEATATEFRLRTEPR